MRTANWILTAVLWVAGANVADLAVWWGYLVREYLFPYAHTGAI